MRAISIFITVFAVTFALRAGTTVPAATVETLESPTYKITIVARWTEGDLWCDDVKYVGVNKRTKKSIVLIGRTFYSMGEDGITPSHFLGYLFKNGRTIYAIYDAGEIYVTRGAKVLVDERGEWKN